MPARRKVSIGEPSERSTAKKPILETRQTEVEINFDGLSDGEIINTILERSSDPVISGSHIEVENEIENIRTN
ncbi:hypothetical protein Aduo_012809 [Ancylostoma duodenale]